MAATPYLFFVDDFLKTVGNNEENFSGVDSLLSTGGAPSSLGSSPVSGVFGGLAIDSAAGVYFITSRQTDDSVIYEEHFGQPLQFTTEVGNGPVATTLGNAVTSLALNASDDILYYTAGTGFYEEKFSGANFSGTATQIQLATLPNSTNASSQQLAFDQADHSAYFAAPGGHITFTTVGTKIVTVGSVTKNYIYKVSGVNAGATAGSLTSQVSVVNLGGPNGELPLTDGEISGVTLDSKTDTLYIITKPGILPTSTNVEGLYAYQISTGTLSTVWSRVDANGSTNALNDMTDITVDPTTGNYYISDGGLSRAPGIYEGNIANIGALPTLLYQDPTTNPANGDVTFGLAIDAPPTVASDKVTAIDGATNHTTGSVTTTDTVTISVTFSQNIFVTGSPTLTLNDGGVAQYVNGSGTSVLVFSYTPGSGQNTATLAATGAVSGGTFADSAGTPPDLTNLAQSFAGLRVQTSPPVVTAGASVQYSEIGAPVALDPGLTVSDPFGSGQLQSATVQITTGFLAGDVLSVNLAGTGLVATYDGAGKLTLTGSASLANYQTALESVTYSSTASDARQGGADASRTLTWSVNDGVLSNTTTATSALSIVPCFVRGARILTERGEIAVENLSVGDVAITASGLRRPIVWIGHRDVDISRHPDPVAVRPVRVRAGAFGEGLPRRDLWLSPGHNIASEGALIAASLLINGRSVAQIAQERVEYWHVELDAHDILLVEGLPAESYLDTGNRTAFASGGAFVEAHPDFRPKHWAETCLPLAFDGPAVTATRSRLLARLTRNGEKSDRDAQPHITVDGHRVDPLRLSASRLAFALPAGGRNIALRSRVFVPAHALADSTDARELGLCVARLEIDGETIDLVSDAGASSGWREPEFSDASFSHRWTTGATPLRAGARIVIIDLAGEGHYWRQPSAPVHATSPRYHSIHRMALGSTGA